jgi:hypothetical protein
MPREGFTAKNRHPSHKKEPVRFNLQPFLSKHPLLTKNEFQQTANNGRSYRI